MHNTTARRAMPLAARQHHRLYTRTIGPPNPHTNTDGSGHSHANQALPQRTPKRLAKSARPSSQMKLGTVCQRTWGGGGGGCWVDSKVLAESGLTTPLLQSRWRALVFVSAPCKGLRPSSHGRVVHRPTTSASGPTKRSGEALAIAILTNNLPKLSPPPTSTS